MISFTNFFFPFFLGHIVTKATQRVSQLALDGFTLMERFVNSIAR